jgi:hypothetical protein
MSVGQNGFWSSTRANNRAGVESLDPFNAEVKKILDSLSYEDVPNPNYMSAEDIDAGGFVTPGTRIDQTAPTIRKYDRAQLKAASEQIGYLAEEMGVSLVATDNNKPYFYNTGIKELNEAMYGPAIKGENSISSTPGTFESPVHSAKWDDYAKAILPAVAVGVIAAPIATSLLNAIPQVANFLQGAGTVNTIAASTVKATATSAVSQMIRNGEIDPGSLLQDAVTNGFVPELIKNAGDFGELFQDKSFAGAFTRGATREAINSAVRDGELNLGDITKAGLGRMGFEVLGDIFRDASQTNDENVLRHSSFDGKHFSQYTPEEQNELLKRLHDTTDLYGLLGPNGALSKMGIDVAYMKTDALGDVLNFFGFGEEYDTQAFKDTLARAQSQMEQGLLSPEEAQQMLWAEAGRYDQRFFDPFAEKGNNSDMTGIWENFSEAYRDSGVASALIDWANDPGTAGQEFSFAPTTPEEPEFADVNEDTVNAADPDIEDPFVDTTQDPIVEDVVEEQPPGNSDGQTSSPTDPTWGQRDWGATEPPEDAVQEVIEENFNSSSPSSVLWEQMHDTSGDFPWAVKGEPNQQFWGTSYYRIADLNKMNNRGITEDMREFARQEWDKLVAAGNDPSMRGGGINGYNRENWVLHGWRNNDELQAAMSEAGVPGDTGGELTGGDELPPGGSDELPPGGDDSGGSNTAGITGQGMMGQKKNPYMTSIDPEYQMEQRRQIKQTSLVASMFGDMI